jgi:hypothetical protein
MAFDPSTLKIGHPHLCEHANECPQSCPCAAGCYCKTRTCKARRTAFDPSTTNWQDLETPIGRAADRSVEELRRRVVQLETALGNISLIVSGSDVAPIYVKDIAVIVDEALRTDDRKKE